ncbi:MAG: sigma-70 family RNA polymerase sigma factor [Pyrinomonadaceae bacterium]|nr:sigma-70 family RNA polymerase sigma factor [Pyrinomonadaceae bacterium]
MTEKLNEKKSETDSHEVTKLLVSWSDGDDAAFDKLFPLVYQNLRKQARSFLRRERSGHTLQTTALVHEAYLKLTDQNSVKWQNRAHFFAIAAQAMRRILLDYARQNIAEKRGGAAQKISLDDAENVSHSPDENLVALDEALNELHKIDVQQSRIVEMRYFGGLTVDETAEVLQISPRTVAREWAMARAWLYRNLNRVS